MIPLPPLVLAFACMLQSAPAAAWNSAGHRLTAIIAWEQLTPPVRDRVSALLAAHPDHSRWIARGGDPALTAFVEASTWPDDIRRDPRFHDTGDPPTPLESGFPDMERHGAWHYVDQTVDGRRLGGELDHQLERLARLLADPRSPISDRSYALPWLVHLVADAHQPLHAGVRDDEGGNRTEIHDPAHPRLATMSLHAWWDDLPGPPWLRGKRLAAAAARLSALYQVPDGLDSSADWLRESREIAMRQAYPDGDVSPGRIDPDFRERARRIAGERVVAAGSRLARLLDGLLGNVSRETERRLPPK